MTQRVGGAGLGGALLAISWLAPQLDLGVVYDKAELRTVYNSEEGSAFIRQHKPDRLLFVWDHPLAKIMDRHTLEQLGGYYLKRAGADVPVHAIVIAVSQDANPVLRYAARGGRPAIIWLSGRSQYSSAGYHPPTFEQDPEWNCLRPNSTARELAGVNSIACVKRGYPND